MSSSSHSSNESIARTTPNEKAMSSQTSIDADQSDYFLELMEDIIENLKDDTLSNIMTEDIHLHIRLLRENVDPNDERGAEIISTIEAFVKEHERLYPGNSVPRIRQPAHTLPHTSLPTVLENLSVAVDKNPDDVTPDVLKAAQAVVSKMQKALGTSNTPHPELEAELQQEVAKIIPKVADGTVTTEEANHLHSLEARAHGHTVRGSITSIAQSVAAKRERQLSMSSGGSGRSRASSKVLTPEEAIKSEIENGNVTEAEAANKFEESQTPVEAK